MAVPSAVAKPTVTVWLLGGERLTGKETAVVPEGGSAMLTSPIDSAERSDGDADRNE